MGLNTGLRIRDMLKLKVKDVKNKDVALLQQIFNHSAPSVTLRYIGINQDIMDNALDDFSL